MVNLYKRRELVRLQGPMGQRAVRWICLPHQSDLAAPGPTLPKVTGAPGCCLLRIGDQIWRLGRNIRLRHTKHVRQTEQRTKGVELEFC